MKYLTIVTIKFMGMIHCVKGISVIRKSIYRIFGMVYACFRRCQKYQVMKSDNMMFSILDV